MEKEKRSQQLNANAMRKVCAARNTKLLSVTSVGDRCADVTLLYFIPTGQQAALFAETWRVFFYSMQTKLNRS